MINTLLMFMIMNLKSIDDKPDSRNESTPEDYFVKFI